MKNQSSQVVAARFCEQILTKSKFVGTVVFTIYLALENVTAPITSIAYYERYSKNYGIYNLGFGLDLFTKTSCNDK